mgnify:CR=1 FL=1
MYGIDNLWICAWKWWKIKKKKKKISDDMKRKNKILPIIWKKFDESRKHFEKAIKIVNDYSKAHFHLAMLLKEKG